MRWFSQTIWIVVLNFWKYLVSMIHFPGMWQLTFLWLQWQLQSTTSTTGKSKPRSLQKKPNGRLSSYLQYAFASLPSCLKSTIDPAPKYLSYTFFCFLSLKSLDITERCWHVQLWRRLHTGGLSPEQWPSKQWEQLPQVKKNTFFLQISSRMINWLLYGKNVKFTMMPSSVRESGLSNGCEAFAGVTWTQQRWNSP